MQLLGLYILKIRKDTYFAYFNIQLTQVNINLDLSLYFHGLNKNFI